ncbi:hypothetical protein NXH76_14700 [Blautia schinkii]|nr:hypothetical protein [Blautia schinkii]
MAGKYLIKTPIHTVFFIISRIIKYEKVIFLEVRAVILVKTESGLPEKNRLAMIGSFKKHSKNDWRAKT